ncbi:hypothetical protein KFK09_014749 [Dendrobium nobile]|uniref:Uncharacterized protein n=1 Tax=Dendrobium nobile TaxID=94219 RepID=A0A8T3B8T6_DENNO|nr:hypothetical protein KFK09_014749 [Dendrobium nobile]
MSQLELDSLTSSRAELIELRARARAQTRACLLNEFEFELVEAWLMSSQAGSKLFN